MNPMNPARRRIAVAALLATIGRGVSAAPRSAAIEVWKDPACGCCEAWVGHLRSNGFQVRSHGGRNTVVRSALGMPMRYGSCHTAEVEGYVLEGHVPAREIHRLLKERPVAVGLAVPAMLRGSPGMDGPEYRGQRDPYDVLLVQRDGSARSYQPYR